MEREYLNNYIKAFCKISVYDIKAGKALGINDGKEFDTFMDKVYEDISTLGEKDLINIIAGIFKKTDQMNGFVYDVIANIINMHSEMNPTMHPIKELISLLEEIMESIDDENPTRRDFYLFLMQYRNINANR